MQIYVQFLSTSITLLVDSNDLYSRFIIYNSNCVYNYFMPTSNYHSLLKNVENNIISEAIMYKHRMTFYKICIFIHNNSPWSVARQSLIIILLLYYYGYKNI